MSATDPIADMLTRMRNAVLMRKREVQIPASRLKMEIARILKEEGFIRNYKVIKDGPQGVLTVTLKYTEGNQSVLAGARRVSKPGCRIYCTRDSIPKVEGWGRTPAYPSIPSATASMAARASSTHWRQEATASERGTMPDSPVSRRFHSTFPSARLRSLTIRRIGAPSRSASANWTPGRSLRSS